MSRQNGQIASVCLCSLHAASIIAIAIWWKTSKHWCPIIGPTPKWNAPKALALSMKCARWSTATKCCCSKADANEICICGARMCPTDRQQNFSSKTFTHWANWKWPAIVCVAHDRCYRLIRHSIRCRIWRCSKSCSYKHLACPIIIRNHNRFTIMCTRSHLSTDAFGFVTFKFYPKMEVWPKSGHVS